MLKRSKLFLLTFFIIFAILVGFSFKYFVDEKPKVVFVLRTLDNQYWEIIRAGIEQGCKDFGIDGKVMAPRNGTAEEQMKMLKNVLEEPPDVLVISPAISPDIIPNLEEFVKRNIPVLLIDTDEPWKNKTAYIGTNNIELGRKAGILMGAMLQPGDKVALIGRESSVERERIKGAKDSLEAAGINIAAETLILSIDDKEYDQNVKKVIGTILLQHPDLKGVITSTDYLAIPVIKVLQEQGLTMPVTGADGIIKMLELIEKGTLIGTVAQNPYDMGYLSVEAALKVTKGEKIKRYIDSGVDIITEDNVKQKLDFLKKVLK
ncbi:sugar ABC transporter substrate-binding protein [Neobacillus sp. WH10]|uniref:sugar ABC transporter substrate-binding protein n=1 Tax=Neobacillus sp. WH10 TaxID=3047873 RepID=UPI0024C0E9B9|nr:sugar ABC transporter substrate-binding protein [Neobacillus sp. WH10]WHY77869.1 sugar ABC transporter substrate-binding protein [Neobacillus sp. WH10]